MNALERQTLRLEILQKLCEELDYDLNRRFLDDYEIIKLFPKIKEEEIIKHILYLGDKGYLKYVPLSYQGMTFPGNIRLETQAIDLIESIETNKSTKQFEDDFSRIAINNFSNNYNSPIIVNSPGAQINITIEESKELIQYFQDLININSENKELKKILENTIKEINDKKATKEFLRGIGSVLLSMGISIASNLLTPGVAAALGIPMG